MKAVRTWGLWILGGLAVLAGLAALGLYLLVAQIDVRKEVERAVEGATGRQLTLNGDVGVSYWPVLGLHAADASLANIEGGRAPALLTAVDIHVGVELWPLLRREVVVRELVLQQPRIFLEVDAEGQPNWMLATPAAPAPPPAPAPGGANLPNRPAVEVARASLRKLSIVDGEVNFHDARRASGWVVGNVDISSDLSDLDRPMELAGDVLFNDKPVKVELELARLGAALRGEPTSLKLRLSGDLLEARFEGHTVAASAELAGVITATGPSLRQLAAWANTPFQGGVGFEPFEVSGRLAIGGGRYEFTNAEFALDRIRGNGDFVLAQHNGKPYLSGLLRLEEFDLNPYLTGQTPPPAEAGASASAELAVVAAPARAIDVATAPTANAIDFSGLRAFNADLDLRTKAVLVQRLRIDSARLNLVINDGFLAATLHEMTLYGGSGSGRFELDSRGPAPRIVEEMAFSNLEARRFLTDAVNFANIEGRAEVSLNLRTQGATQTEMIAAADGRVHIEVISGVLHGVDLGGVSRTIRNALRGELIAPQARTPFLGFSATFAVADGVLASDDLSFNTADLRIPGIGLIDLPGRRADLRLAPRSPRGGLVFPFSIRGPWGQSTYAGDFNGRVQRELLARVVQVEAAARAPVN
jgi:AsmA protein